MARALAAHAHTHNTIYAAAKHDEKRNKIDADNRSIDQRPQYRKTHTESNQESEIDRKNQRLKIVFGISFRSITAEIPTRKLLIISNNLDFFALLILCRLCIAHAEESMRGV